MSIEQISNSIDQAIKIINNAQKYFGLLDNNTIPNTLSNEVADVCAYVKRILERSSRALQIRKEAERVLFNLIDQVERNTNEVIWNDIKIPFDIARTLSFQAYTGIVWIIYDLILEAHNYFICSNKYRNIPSNHPRLVKTILRQNGDNIRAIDAEMVIKAYGWPIGVSYCVRNIFAHESDALHDGDIFEGFNVDSGYRVTMELYRHINSKCKVEYNVDENFTRYSDPWPWGEDDLFKMLSVCNKEIDDVVSGLLKWTFQGFEHLVAALSSRD